MLRSAELIALPLHLSIDYDDAAGIDCDQATGDMGVFIVPFKCIVVRAGVVVTETCAGLTTTPVIKFDKRPTAGSDGSRGDGDVANLVLSTTVQGKVMYDEVYKGTVLTPGEEVVVELAVAAVGVGKTGHVHPFLLVEYLPETKVNLTDMTETA